LSTQPDVLIIDDDKTSGIVLAKLVENEHLTPLVLNHPKALMEALPTLTNLKVIFLDLEMPHLDGYEVLALLREHFGDALPIVAYTVHTTEYSNAMQKGFHAFMGKPVNGAAFPKNLQRILRGERIPTVL
jgi:CheY-like chemotaxis protein